MGDTAALAFATLFAVIDPVGVAALYAVLTVDYSPTERNKTALKGVLIAGVILLLFAVTGDQLLARLGITLAALRTAGGILLLLIGIDMVFARGSGGVSTTPSETLEAQQRDDIAVFPLATPLIAGPGTMSAVILLMASARGNVNAQLEVIAVMLLVLLISYLLLRVAGQIEALLGNTGLKVVSRILGVLLTALAVQLLFDGIGDSGLFSQLAVGPKVGF